MASTITLPAKRKRTQVSYVDHDDELDALLGIDLDETVDEVVTEVFGDDYDTEYGSRKKVPKKRKLNKTGKGTTTKGKRRKPFPFMSLPAELRDEIYEMALVDFDGLSLISRTKNYRRTVTRGIIPEDQSHGYYNRRSRRRARTRLSQGSDAPAEPEQLVPALLRVNKQIHDEAIGYLYQQPITLEDTYALHSFLATIGSNRSIVTDITIKGWGCGRGAHKSMNFTSLTLLSTCPNLKMLSLDCSIGWLRNPKELARQIYRDGYHFLEAYGSAQGRKDAGVDILELDEWNFDKANSYWHRHRNALPEKDDFKTQFQSQLRKMLGC